MKVNDKLVVFEDKKIRRIFHKGEWYFSILDVIRILTDSSNPRRYWPELKKQLINNECFAQLLGKIEQLKLESSDGKKYLTDTANTETMFRIIQSIKQKDIAMNGLKNVCAALQSEKNLLMNGTKEGSKFKWNMQFLQQKFLKPLLE